MIGLKPAIAWPKEYLGGDEGHNTRGVCYGRACESTRLELTGFGTSATSAVVAAVASFSVSVDGCRCKCSSQAPHPETPKIQKKSQNRENY